MHHNPHHTGIGINHYKGGVEIRGPTKELV
jgi:hypothetical protein